MEQIPIGGLQTVADQGGQRNHIALRRTGIGKAQLLSGAHGLIANAKGGQGKGRRTCGKLSRQGAGPIGTGQQKGLNAAEFEISGSRWGHHQQGL
jgi:hypothetical protein